jgi:hypothetical protein
MHSPFWEIENMASKKKSDGRKNNGAEDRGLGEAAYLVRGPAALIDAMKKEAERSGQTISTVWRKAAELYLSSR